MNSAFAKSLHSPSLLPPNLPLESLTGEAIAFLQKFEPPNGYFVGFSGGKDSIVTLALCRMAGVRHEAVYSCTGIDAPEVVRFIRRQYVDVAFAYPKITFWEGIRRHSPPLRMQRWCCNLLKKSPVKRHPLFRHSVLGIRAEESSRRAARGRVEITGKRKIRVIYKPIFHWDEGQIWGFIQKNKLPYPCLYDEGFSRIGCVICPFIMHRNQHQLLRHKARWPQLFRVFEKVTADWHSQRTHRNLDIYGGETAEQYLAAYYRGFELPLPTGNGGKK
ncbi:MAG: phosphoadenosine phosphosulfate reductase family protein [Desulfovibrio sp.]|jgi:phosphoadenosine phosphosulfate reductase|nr:phosphoadenosine phosphosulfate reductase family protein [Desulfovibrio sp.]